MALAGTLLSDASQGSKLLVVSDAVVGKIYGTSLLKSLEGAGLEAELYLVPAGESSKSLCQAELLYDRLAAMRLRRDGMLIALGGGMVSDLAGFVAATWLRGVRFVICPTSLEAMIDAAIGGKTALNHASGKNLIGAYHQPRWVIIDSNCLKSLPQRDFVAGMAESLKHALIQDEAFLTWQEQQGEVILAQEAVVMEELIFRNVKIKTEVVRGDAREQTGWRARLNFGHTIGHAIEASCGYALRHGECVALGMVAAARISQQMGLLSAEAHARILRVLQGFALPVRWDGLASNDELLYYMTADKKTASSRLNWVLLEDIGRTVLRNDVEEALIREAMNTLR